MRVIDPSNILAVQEMVEAPLLFMVFNRPNATRRSFAAIREARPRRLYVAADGPRKDRETDSGKVAQVQEIATAVDWDCEVKTLFRSHNLGCGKAVSEAITWFFENEEMGIILEDDCVPHPDFWRFCDELLQRYREDQRVMAIAGTNFNKGQRRTTYSYYFSRHYHFWGWATWARAWHHFDYNMKLWPMIKQDCLLDSLCTGERGVANYWERRFDQVSHGLLDTWDYQWTFACWLQNGLQVIPDANLVSNIGFDHEATHTKNRNTASTELPVGSMAFPLKHPPVVMRNLRADRCFAREWLAPTLAARVTKRIRRLCDRLLVRTRPAEQRTFDKFA